MKNQIMHHKTFATLILIFAACTSILAQDKAVLEAEKTAKKNAAAATNYTWDGNKAIAENDFVVAEAKYRKAIAKSETNTAAPYNLGNAYFEKESYKEAFSRYKQTAELAENKVDKHRAFHNMGNVFMKEKQYENAVEAYKNALRNDPSDEETRYNLALAKELLKKQQDEDKKNEDKKDDQNKDQDKKEDQKDDKQDKNEGGDKEKKDDGKPKDDENKDKGDEGDKGDEKKEENKKGEGDEKKEEKKKPEDQEPQEPKQRKSQLSPQQIQNLLEAMQNEEKKAQEKVNAKKVKGRKVKNEKDW